MTTIVALQLDNAAVAATDSRLTEYFGETWSEYSTLAPSNPKLASNGKYILGAAGDLRAINILHHAFQPPACPPNLKGRKLDHFVTTKFIPALRACFDEQGYSQPENKDGKDHAAQHGSQILCMINNSIYIIDGDYSWYTNSTGIYAIGSGSGYALGALSAIAPSARSNVQNAKKALTKALSISARFDPATGGPFTSYIQEGPKKEVVQKSVKTQTPKKPTPRKKSKK